MPTSTTKPVGPGAGSPLSDINVAEVILKVLAGDGRTPPATSPDDGSTLPEPRRNPGWIMNFGRDPRAPVQPEDFDPSTITDPMDEIARTTGEDGEVHPLIRLLSRDPAPTFRNGGPDGQANPAGWFLLGAALVALYLLWEAAKNIPTVATPPKDTAPPDPPPAPDPPPEPDPQPDGGDDERRDPDAPGNPVDDAAVLRQTLTSLLGSGRYTDPASFMVAAKATVDGLMSGKLNALGLLLTGRELNGGGSLGLSAESAAKFAGHPDVAKLLKQMPFRPDLEGAAFLIRAGELFMSLSRIQASLAADESQSRKPVKPRRGKPEP